MDFLFSQNGRIMLYEYILKQFNADIDLLSLVKNVLTGWKPWTVLGDGSMGAD